MQERKCPKCQTWNKAEKYCANCGQVLDYAEEQRLKVIAEDEAERNRKKDRLEIWMEKLRKHPKWFVRLFYRIVYTTSIFFGLIGAFLAWLTAMANG